LFASTAKLVFLHYFQYTVQQNQEFNFQPALRNLNFAGLNDLNFLAGDLANTYLNASCCEKIWFKGGIKTGKDRGKILIVTRALYGLKLSGAAWSADLAARLCNMKFTSS
jgi:hypothetical protein